MLIASCFSDIFSSVYFDSYEAHIFISERLMIGCVKGYFVVDDIANLSDHDPVRCKIVLSDHRPINYESEILEVALG